MKPSTKDRIQGRIRELKGTVKRSIGAITKNRDLETEGQYEQVAGKLQKRIGEMEMFAGR